MFMEHHNHLTFFYLTNHRRRFRTFKGDFMYHKIMWRNGYEWSYLEDCEIQRNDPGNLFHYLFPTMVTSTQKLMIF